MTTEHELENAARAGFRDAMADTETPTDTLRDAAMARGRRLQRRRQTLVAVGAAAAVAAVGIAGQAAVGGGPQSAEVAGGSSSSPSAVASSTAAEPSPSSTPTEDELVDWWNMRAPEILKRLKPMLPEGVEVTDVTLIDEGDEWQPPHVEVGTLYGDFDPPADGPSQFEFDFHPPRYGPYDEATTCFKGESEVLTSCEQWRGPGGVQGMTEVLEAGEIRGVVVSMQTPDGGMIYLASANAAEGKWPQGAQKTAEEIPLTIAQMRQIVSDPSWLDYNAPPLTGL